MPAPAGWKQGGRLPAETRAYVGGITKTLKWRKSGLDLVKLTRPDGATVKIDAGQVTAVRAPLPGEYAARRQGGADPGPTQAPGGARGCPRSRTAAIRATGGSDLATVWRPALAG